MNKAERVAKYGAEIEKMHGKLTINANDASIEQPKEVRKVDHLQAYYQVKQIVDDAKAQCDRAMAIIDVKEPKLEELYAKVKDQLDAVESAKLVALQDEAVIEK